MSSHGPPLTPADAALVARAAGGEMLTTAEEQRLDQLLADNAVAQELFLFLSDELVTDPSAAVARLEPPAADEIRSWTRAFTRSRLGVVPSTAALQEVLDGGVVETVLLLPAIDGGTASGTSIPVEIRGIGNGRVRLTLMQPTAWQIAAVMLADFHLAPEDRKSFTESVQVPVPPRLLPETAVQSGRGTRFYQTAKADAALPAKGHGWSQSGKAPDYAGWLQRPKGTPPAAPQIEARGPVGEWGIVSLADSGDRKFFRDLANFQASPDDLAGGSARLPVPWEELGTPASGEAKLTVGPLSCATLPQLDSVLALKFLDAQPAEAAIPATPIEGGCEFWFRYAGEQAAARNPRANWVVRLHQLEGAE
jgi:hypothetical protein